MRPFTVYVPENKVPFFMELVNSLRFKVKEGKTEDIELSDAHKAILDQRLENYKNNPDSYQDWEDVQKDIEKIL
ncbi:MAG: addiction module protein [Bacteroidales bacterium]|nr:addiction module protein [Bacteroidales bacterium]